MLKIQFISGLLDEDILNTDQEYIVIIIYMVNATLTIEARYNLKFQMIQILLLTILNLQWN